MIAPFNRCQIERRGSEIRLQQFDECEWSEHRNALEVGAAGDADLRMTKCMFARTMKQSQLAVVRLSAANTAKPCQPPSVETTTTSQDSFLLRHGGGARTNFTQERGRTTRRADTMMPAGCVNQWLHRARPCAQSGTSRMIQESDQKVRLTSDATGGCGNNLPDSRPRGLGQLLQVIRRRATADGVGPLERGSQDFQLRCELFARDQRLTFQGWNARSQPRAHSIEMRNAWGQSWFCQCRRQYSETGNRGSHFRVAAY